MVLIEIELHHISPSLFFLQPLPAIFPPSLPMLSHSQVDDLFYLLLLYIYVCIHVFIYMYIYIKPTESIFILCVYMVL